MPELARQLIHLKGSLEQTPGQTQLHLLGMIILVGWMRLVDCKLALLFMVLNLFDCFSSEGESV